MLTITESNDVYTVNVITRTGVMSPIGEIIACDDGEYVFFSQSEGFMRAWVLRDVVMKLEELNEVNDYRYASTDTP